MVIIIKMIMITTHNNGPSTTPTSGNTSTPLPKAAEGTNNGDTT